MAKGRKGTDKAGFKRRVLRPGESVKQTENINKYHDGKPHFAYSWKLGIQINFKVKPCLPS